MYVKEMLNFKIKNFFEGSFVSVRTTSIKDPRYLTHIEAPRFN